jgi:hypothetical protein
MQAMSEANVEIVRAFLRCRWIHGGAGCMVGVPRVVRELSLGVGGEGSAITTS